MIPNDDLFDLIKSMSVSEKGYFKKFSSGFAKGNHKNYIRLFDALSSLKEYDEKQFRKKFQREKFIQHLSSEKSYLYNLILRILKLYHEATSVDFEIQDCLARVEILFDRGLYAQAKKILQEAKKLTVDHEKFYLHLEVIDWEHLMPSHDIMGLSEERKSVVGKIENHTQLQYLFKQIQLLRNKYEFAGSQLQLEEFENIYAKVKESIPQSVTAETLKYFCTTIYFAFGLVDLQKAKKNQLAMIGFLEKNLHITLERFDTYITSLGLMVDFLFQLKETELGFQYLEKINSLNPSSLKYQGNKFNAYYNRLLAFNNFCGQFEISLKYIPELEKGLKLYESQMGSFIVRFDFIIFHTYFGLNDFKKANYYLNKMISNPFVSEMEQRDIIIRLLQLINCFELEDIEQLEHRIVSTYRYLKKRNQLSKFELIILKFVRTLTSLQNKSNLLELFIKTKKELTELFKDELENRVNSQFDFICWIESKIEGISYADAVRRWYAELK
jgi:hypothetical protein